MPHISGEINWEGVFIVARVKKRKSLVVTMRANANLVKVKQIKL